MPLCEKSKCDLYHSMCAYKSVYETKKVNYLQIKDQNGFQLFSNAFELVNL